MCMNILCACIHMYHVHVWCQQRTKEGAGSPRTRVMGDCEGTKPSLVRAIRPLNY